MEVANEKAARGRKGEVWKATSKEEGGVSEEHSFVDGDERWK